MCAVCCACQVLHNMVSHLHHPWFDPACGDPSTVSSITMAPRDRRLLEGLGEVLLGLATGDTGDEDWACWLRTPLRAAASQGDLRIVETLLKAGASCRGCRDQEGVTPLHAAANGGERAMCAFGHQMKMGFKRCPANRSGKQLVISSCSALAKAHLSWTTRRPCLCWASAARGSRPHAALHNIPEHHQ